MEVQLDTFDKSKVDWSFYVNEDGSLCRLLVAACDAGLCNRLFVLSGARRLAQKLGRKFILWWPVNGESGVGCRFNDLFETPLRLFNQDDLHWLLDVSHSLKVYEKDFYAKIRRDDPELILLLKLYYWPRFEDEVDEAYPQAELEIRQLLGSLKPSAEILEHVAQLNLDPGAFGVHVRCESSFRESTLDKFFGAVDRELQRERRQFFLATDWLPVELCFKHRYGELCRTQPKVWLERRYDDLSPARATLTGMVEAAVDLYALASRRLVIGTAKSTFSQVASMLAGDPRCTLVEV
jgi:hypothetical protein